MIRAAFVKFPTKIVSMSSRLLSNYKAVNEEVLTYAPGSKERAQLEESLSKYSAVTYDIPIVIGDEEFYPKESVRYQVSPFNHGKKIGKYHYAPKELIQKAIANSLEAKVEWQKKPLAERCQIFLDAADLLSRESRMDVVACTMLGQAKTIVQAEIDAAAELIDFYRFDVQFAMGNVVVWKPSDTAILSNYIVYRVLRQAGLPPGVINFVPADGPTFGQAITESPHLAGINFTGSVPTFTTLWKSVANNLDTYKSFPRLIGECGGKNFHFVHKSADVESVVKGTTLGAFEYSGQKCSACSRMYVPDSLWPQIKEGLMDLQKQLKVGSPLDGDTFTSAVIDDKSFNRIKSYIDYANKSPEVTILAGGNCDDSKGYFVEPTIIQVKNPQDKLLKEEIFGPVLSIYVYPDDSYREILDIINSTSPFALTGSVFAQEQSIIDEATDALHHSTGNFYINDKSTGSVVGQQPFGGARKSGTNDKAGGPHYLLRFCSPQSTKHTLVPLTSWRYPSMD